jgi:hypothetical protein
MGINSINESSQSYTSKADWNAAPKKLNDQHNDKTSIGNGKIFKVTEVQPRESVLRPQDANSMRRKDSLFHPPESVANGRVAILKSRGSVIKPQKQSALRRKDSVFHPPGSIAKRGSIIDPQKESPFRRKDSMFGGPNVKPKARGSVYISPNPILKPRGSMLNPRGSVLNPRGSMPDSLGSILKPRGSILKPRGSILNPRGSILKPVDQPVKPRKSTVVSTGLNQVLPDPRPGSCSLNIAGLEKTPSPCSTLINDISTPAHPEKSRLENKDGPVINSSSLELFSSMGYGESIDQSNFPGNKNGFLDSLSKNSRNQGPQGSP